MNLEEQTPRIKNTGGLHMAAKGFASVGGADGDNYGGESPVVGNHHILHHPSRNVTVINSLHHSPQGQGTNKMVRKRAASEIEIHHTSGGRFPRRAAPPGNGDYSTSPPPNPTVAQHSTQVPNYSTMTMMSSTNFNILMASGKSGSGSNITAAHAAFSNSYTTTTAALTNSMDSASSQSNQTSSTAAPPVCVFSGLPLFPPDHRHGNRSTGLQASPGMEDTTAWVDGIIKDLINGSNHVSIHQLILNVREIIHPCNPNLAALLEYRLRSLTPSPSPSPSTPIEDRLKEAPSFPNSNSSSLFLSQSQGVSAANDDWPNNNAGNSHVYIQNNIINPTTTTTPAALSFPSTIYPNSDQQPQEKSPSSSSADLAAATKMTTSPPPLESLKERKEEMRQKQKDEQGLHLLTLLLQCAEAVSADNLEDANKMLLEISQLATPFGTSAQRVAAYFSEAMSARIVSSCLGIYAALPIVPHSQKMASAFQVFNGISPFVKFSHFTANQAIQEAFEREDRVHIIDLDIMQGLQWPGLFHILASRPGGPPFVRLTGLGNSSDALEATGKRLSDFAHKLGLPFEFSPIADRVGNLNLERLNVSKREAVAVHWLQHSLYDVTGSDTNTLCLLQRYYYSQTLPSINKPFVNLCFTLILSYPFAELENVTLKQKWYSTAFVRNLYYYYYYHFH